MATNTITAADAAAKISEIEKANILALKDLVSAFLMELASIDANNDLPTSFNSEGRNMTSNIRGAVQMNSQMLDMAYNRYFPVQTPQAVA